MPVTTVYPSTDFQISSNGISYARAKDAISSTLTTDNSAENYVGQRTQNATSFWVYQSLLAFDTSFLGSDDLHDVELSISGFTDLSNSDFDIQARDASSFWNGTTISTTYFRTSASLSGYTLLASFDTSGYTTSGFNTFTNNGTALLDALNTAGLTRIHLSSDEQLVSSEPTGNERVSFHASEETGTTNDPKLVISHGAPNVDASQTSTITNSSIVNNASIVVMIDVSQTDSLTNTSTVESVVFEEVLSGAQSSSVDNISSVNDVSFVVIYTVTQTTGVDNESDVLDVEFTVTAYTATQSESIENTNSIGDVLFSAPFPTYQYLVDWHNSGNFSGPYDDVTAYVKDARWSLGMKQAYQYMPDESECALTLINTDRRFSPENEGSPIYGLMLPNRRVKVVVTNGFDPPKTVWYGYLDSINPTPMQYAGPFTTTLKAVGPKQILDRSEIALELLENVTTDEAVAAILEQAQVAPVATGTWRLGSVGSSELGSTTYLANVTLPQDLEVGVVTLPFVGDNWDRFSTAFEALASVVLAEQGKLFFSRDGTIVFWNRNHIANIDTADHIFDNTFQGIEYTFGKEVINNISVTYYPRAISTTADDVVWNLDEPITIAGGESQELQANFSSEEGVKVGAKDVVMPNTGDGTLAFSSGSGTISSWEVSADSVKMTLTNDSPSSAVTFSTIIIKGKKITTFNSQTITEYDNSSISYYGKRSKSIDLKLVTSADDARSIAQNELIRYKQPRGVVRSIRIPNRDMENALLQINLGIGSSIAIGETQTQHSYRYIIIGESHQWKASGKDTVTTFYLEPVSSLVPWRLGTVGRSELGSTTKLGL